MKIAIGLLFVSLSFQLDGQEGAYVFKNVNVLTMLDDQVLINQDVIIDEGIIQAVNPTGQIDLPDYEVIDGSGRFLMPGLSEMHAHIPVSDDDDKRVDEVMMLYLAHGVTTIRGMLGHPQHLDLKMDFIKQTRLSPRIYTSSPSMNGRSVATKEDARLKVRDAASKGYDFLKIHPGIQSDVMDVLVETAHASGIAFSGHVPEDVGIESALRHGYSTIDHMDGYIQGLVDEYQDNEVGFFGAGLINKINTEEIDKLVQLTVEKGVKIVPTQTLFTRWYSPISGEEMINQPEMKFMPAKTRYQWVQSKNSMTKSDSFTEEDHTLFIETRCKVLKALFDAGVEILLGSDSPQVMNVPGYSIHHEIEAVRQCGIPLFDILEGGTSKVAEFFDSKGVFGTIQEGAHAEIILVEENPLKNHKTLLYPTGTMINGVWLTREYMDQQLEQIAQRHVTE